jgi:hypothetical protein
VRRRPAVLIGLCLAAGIGAVSTAAAEQSHLVIVVGLGGEKKYSDAFHQMAVSMVGAAEKKLGLGVGNIVYLGEKTADPAVAVYGGRATRESVQKALAGVARRAAPGDLVFVLLIGHGSAQTAESRFNLAGPDMSAADFLPLLDALAAQAVVLVNAASASGDFTAALAGKGRTIVTATKSALERNQTVFAKHFVDAFTGEGADADKDQRVSLLEAFEYARREVARFYEKDRRLLTEHAVLADGADGAVARSIFLGAGAEGGEGRAGTETDDPALPTLLQERRDVERRLEALRAGKATAAPEEYEKRLEALLLELALKDEAIRKRSAGRTR